MCFHCWVLSFLCIFWITVLYQITPLQIFSSSLRFSLSILLILSFTEWKILVLMKFILWTLSLMDHALLLYLKIHHAQGLIQFFFILHLGLLSILINFCEGKVYIFYIYTCISSCSRTICWVGWLCPIGLSLLVLGEQLTICIGSVSGFCVPLICLPVLLLISHYLDYCSFLINVVVEWCQSSGFVFLQ